MRIGVVLFLALLSACMLRPPAQEMAEARSAVKAAREIPGHSVLADRYLRQAEEALKEAAQAIRKEDYSLARSKAAYARSLAQKAARLKQQTNQY